MAADSFRFLDSWTQLLPRQGGAVVALAGSGGCTTLLLRVIEEITGGAGGGDPVPRRVLVTQTTAHPVPIQYRDALHVFDAGQPVLRDAWKGRGLIWVAGELEDEQNDRRRGLRPDQCEAVARALEPDVVLVQAHASCGRPLRRDGIDPIWPERAHLALVVAPLSVVGRPWDERSVAGAVERIDDAGEPRRVQSRDVIEQLRAQLGALPPGVRPLPFLTGFGSYRDLDGMFEMVQALWDPPRIPVVCLGELLGDVRRDAADLRAWAGAPAATALSGDRVYAIYPVSTDPDEEE